MEKIKINLLDNYYEYDKGISLSEVALDFRDKYKYSILAGFVDNEFWSCRCWYNYTCKIENLSGFVACIEFSISK